MLGVPGRVRVVAGRNGVLAPDFSILTLDDQFAPALIAEHSFCGFDGITLRPVKAGSLIRIVALIRPIAIRPL